jgi:hypothetical protein
MCTTCMQELTDAHFDGHKLATWRTPHCSYRDAVCIKCFSNRVGPFGGLTRMKRSFTCQQCSIEKDSCLYGSKDIIRHTRQDTVCELVCLECTPSRARHLTKDSYTCTSCEKLLSVDAFSVSMQKCRDFRKWRCECCRCPTCTSCGLRQPTSLKRSVVLDAHICQKCMYPPCPAGCGAARPCQRFKYCVRNKALWTCAACRNKTLDSSLDAV